MIDDHTHVKRHMKGRRKKTTTTKTTMMMTTPLPSSRTLIDALFTQISIISPSQGLSDPSGSDWKPLDGFAPKDRQLLITLHCVWPKDFLPALDLLDRRLVTSFEVEGRTALYYVRSTQISRARYHGASATATSSSHYEVRSSAWNCSCPAFAFAAFGQVSLDGHLDCVPNEPIVHEGGVAHHRTSFGGYTLGEEVAPVCKHLLACFLAERCEKIFGPYVERRQTSVEEMAAWAAGWGD